MDYFYEREMGILYPQTLGVVARVEGTSAFMRDDDTCHAAMWVTSIGAKIAFYRGDLVVLVAELIAYDYRQQKGRFSKALFGVQPGDSCRFARK